jgi:glyoxylase-like metal-dependent hydrolase (beta-lactamase superfamily II)
MCHLRSLLVTVITSTSFLAPATAPAQSAADSARAAVAKAATALGGSSALRSLTTIHREFTVENSDPTQGARPAQPGETEPPIYLRDRRILDTDYTRNLERTLVEGTIYGNQPSRLVRVNRPDSVAGVNLTLRTSFGFPARAAAPVGQLMPEGLIRRALAASPDSLTWIGTRRDGDRMVAVVRFGEPNVPFVQRLVIDQETGQLALEADTDDPVLGDVLTRFVFLDYRPVGNGLTLPHRIEQRRNGVLFQAFVVRSVVVNKPIADSLFTVPPGFPPDPPPPATLTAAPIGRDLYLIRATYNSLFLVASDHVIVIEAPVNSRRTNRVLEEIRRVAPGKPIKYVIATHFHSDHIGGLRPFIAAGIPILTTATAREVIERSLARGTRTRSPDTLSAAPRDPVVEVVHGRRTLGDQAHPVEIIDLSPNPHADEILAVWFPTERLLFEGDMLDLLVPEGEPSMPGDDTRALARAIGTFGLDVDRIVPVHGRPGTKADLDRTLARSHR